MILGDFGSMAICSSAFGINPVFMGYTYKQCSSTPARWSLSKKSLHEKWKPPLLTTFSNTNILLSLAHPNKHDCRFFVALPTHLFINHMLFIWIYSLSSELELFFVQKHLISFFHFLCSCRPCFNIHQAKRLKQIFHDRACIGQSHAWVRLLRKKAILSLIVFL